MNKTCSKCKIEKDINQFSKDKNNKDGRFSWCKKCRGKHAADYYQKTKSNILLQYQIKRKEIYDYTSDYKSSRGCSKCGESHVACLDFHHIRDKSFTISNLRIYDKKLLQEEIDKCIILCSNCHRKLHYYERLEKQSK